MSSDGRHIYVCALVPYPPDTVPGQRFRIEQWLPELAAQGIEVELRSFADESLMRILHQPGRHAAKAIELAKQIGDGLKVWAVRCERPMSLTGE